LDIRSLKTLIAVADHGSFAAAGSAVGISQSAVSLQMKGLEGRLGRRLFDRNHRPPLLNAEGRALVSRAREVVRQWEGLADSFKAPAGSLGLGAIPTVISGVLPQALVRLRAESPKLKIRLTTGLSHELEQLVDKQRLDAAVVTQPREVAPELCWYPFAREPLVVIAPDGTPGDSDRALLEGPPFIRFRRFAWAGQLIDAEIGRRGIAVKPQMEIDSLEGIALLVAQPGGDRFAGGARPWRVGRPAAPGGRALPAGDQGRALRRAAGSPDPGLAGAHGQPARRSGQDALWRAQGGERTQIRPPASLSFPIKAGNRRPGGPRSRSAGRPQRHRSRPP
jgi:DNA-binding transcriptional LysR family regulator